MDTMLLQESIITSIHELFQKNTLISISGKAGTGKTSLSLYLIGNFLTSTQPYESLYYSCRRINLRQILSKKRSTKSVKYYQAIGIVK